MELPPGLRLSFEDQPSWADREFNRRSARRLQRAVSARPELFVFRHFRARRYGWRDPRWADRQLLRWLAVCGPALGASGFAPGWDRAPLDGVGRTAWPRVRVPFGLGRHLFVPGAGILPEAWLRRV